MFMHASFLHIAGNMLFLWIFGNNIEDSMGPVKYVGFYMLGGIAALALQTLIGPSSTAPYARRIGRDRRGARRLHRALSPRAGADPDLHHPVLHGDRVARAAGAGASGSSSRRCSPPADLTNPTGSGGGVAYFAHIGGFAFGVTTVKLLATRRRSIPPRYPVYLTTAVRQDLVFTVALLFIVALAVLTVRDIRVATAPPRSTCWRSSCWCCSPPVSSARSFILHDDEHVLQGGRTRRRRPRTARRRMRRGWSSCFSCRAAACWC